MLKRKKKGGAKPGLPSQKELMRTCIRPGRNVELIVSTDFDRDAIDVRTSIIHDVDRKGRLILDQTQPRLGSQRVGEAVELTVLARFRSLRGGTWLRAGYRAKILGVYENVRVRGELMESVLAVSAPKQLTRFTLRLNYRLTPAGDADINLYLWPRRSKVAIIDISAGGVKFAHPRGWEFKLGAPLKLAVESGGEAMLFDAEVVRANERLGSSFSAMEHTAVRFVRTPPEERRKLVRVIQDLARRELARRSGLADEDRP